MKLLTFLGIGKYTPVRYVWDNREYETELFPEALTRWLKPSEVLVLLTAEAKQHPHWIMLQERLSSLVTLTPVDIPSGRSETELWDIFTRLTDRLKDGDDVVFDVTHAFRSIPILCLLAAAYLRVAKSVHLQAIVYGAEQAKDENGCAPVFDLTPFLSLLDWVTATDQFLKTGNGQTLAELLQAEDPTAQSLADSINGIAQGLHLLRPMDVMREAAELPQHIAAAAPTVSRSVPPLATLLKRVERDYGAFGLQNPMDYATNAKACLMRQLKMVQWYAEKGQIVHALSLAREWLPSLLCFHFNIDPREKAEREDMELLLSGGTIKDDYGNVVKESPRLLEWSGVPNGKQLRSLWGGTLNLANLRNDVLHAGFRKNPKDVETIRSLTTQIIQELKAIAAAWRIEDEA